MKKIWKDILAIGALAFISAHNEQLTEDNETLKEERDELQARLDEREEDEAEWESET